jgi:hypothetical protein
MYAAAATFRLVIGWLKSGSKLRFSSFLRCLVLIRVRIRIRMDDTGEEILSRCIDHHRNDTIRRYATSLDPPLAFVCNRFETPSRLDGGSQCNHFSLTCAASPQLIVCPLSSHGSRSVNTGDDLFLSPELIVSADSRIVPVCTHNEWSQQPEVESLSSYNVIPVLRTSVSYLLWKIAIFS